MSQSQTSVVPAVERPSFLNRLALALFAVLVVVAGVFISLGVIALAASIIGFLLSVAVGLAAIVAGALVLLIAGTKIGIIFSDLFKK